MEDRIIYTALCYVEMLSLQFTCEYTIQVIAFKCLFNLNFKAGECLVAGEGLTDNFTSRIYRIVAKFYKQM